MKQLCQIFALAVITIFTAVPASAQISKPVGLLKGDVTSSTGEYLTGVNVTIFKGTERVTSTKSNSDGKFTEVLQPNATYRIAISSDEYGYTEDTIAVPPLDLYQEFTMHIVLTAFHSGELSLGSPVFLPKSSIIEGVAMPDLEKVVEQMRHSPKMSLIVTVYPDAKIKSKKDAAQQRLANSRAAAIRSFFLGKNISANRVTVLTGSTIPPGRFAASETLSRTSTKKKKLATKSKLIPQYVEIAAHVG